MLQALKALGYVVQEVEADVEMRGIAQATREAVHLGAFDENAVIDIHKVDADYGLRMQSRIGRRNPLYSTAIGKVLLAGMDPADAREVLSHVEFRKSTQKTLAPAEPG